MAPYDPPAKNVPEVDDETVATEMNEPLLSIQTTMSVDEEESNTQEASVQWTNCYSCVIGLIIGCFIQFSSLGANFLMTTMYGNNVFFMKEFVVVSLIWCFVTSIMGVCVLLFLRSLVVTSFYATTAVNEAFKSKEDFVAGLIQQMEYFFAVGALIGVCMSWTVTDIVLGMKAHIVHSLVTLAIALAWCRLVMTFCGSQTTSSN